MGSRLLTAVPAAAVESSIARGLSCVLLAEHRELQPQRCLRNLGQVKGRIERGEDVRFQLVEGADVRDRNRDDTEVRVHPPSQLHLVNRHLSGRLCEDRTEASPQCGELVLLAQMHRGDPAHRVFADAPPPLRVAPARPA